MIKPKKQPAFPISEETTDRLDEGVTIYTGITIRDYFAAKAMQGIWSNPNIEIDPNSHKNFAALAFKIADAMLAQREK